MILGQVYEILLIFTPLGGSDGSLFQHHFNVFIAVQERLECLNANSSGVTGNFFFFQVTGSMKQI